MPINRVTPNSRPKIIATTHPLLTEFFLSGFWGGEGSGGGSVSLILPHLQQSACLRSKYGACGYRGRFLTIRIPAVRLNRSQRRLNGSSCHACAEKAPSCLTVHSLAQEWKPANKIGATFNDYIEVTGRILRQNQNRARSNCINLGGRGYFQSNDSPDKIRDGRDSLIGPAPPPS